MRQPPAHCHSPEHVVNYSEISEQRPPQKSDEAEEPQFKETINPLLSFSNADLAAMNQDFDQFFESDSSSDDEPVDIGTNCFFSNSDLDFIVFVFNFRKPSN